MLNCLEGFSFRIGLKWPVVCLCCCLQLFPGQYVLDHDNIGN